MVKAKWKNNDFGVGIGNKRLFGGVGKGMDG